MIDGVPTKKYKTYLDVDEALMAYGTGNLALEEPCRIRMKKVIDGEEHSRLVDTTIGRVIFNQAIPQDLGMQKRETIDDMFKLEINDVCGKKMLAKIVDAVVWRNSVDFSQPRVSHAQLIRHFSANQSLLSGF